MEHSIGSVISKTEALVVKLEGLERSKLKNKDSALEVFKQGLGGCLSGLL